MPAAPDFRLYHGNDLEILADVLAAQLARADAGVDPLVPDTILIPQPSMRRWLQATLARTYGVAANLRFLTPGEFVREALHANLGDDDVATTDAAPLRWRVWERLTDARMRQSRAFAPLRALLDTAQPSRAAWSLAGDVAAAFEKYQAWRRDWLLRWDGGEAPNDWQAQLWRQATQGTVHRGKRLSAYLERFGDDAGSAVPLGLPQRLFAFCCQNVSPDVLRVIASQARAGTLHFFFVSPVETWWGDLQTARERARAQATSLQGPVAGSDGWFDDDDENPLLRANGVAGRDFVRLLFSYEAAHPAWEQAIYVPPDAQIRRGVLHRMQRDLLARRAPAQADVDASANDLAPTHDTSLQFHRCHTRLREVQVLHDRLRALLDADPTLQPRDIAVLTPDIDRYAPYVHAVFGALHGDAQDARRRFIPYALADGSALAAHPLIETFLHVLALPDSRFGASEVLALLAQPAIAERFDLDPASLDALQGWLHTAGVRWALDARHRGTHGAPEEPAYTWAWALDRILLGHAGGDDTMFEGVAPWPELEGSAIETLDAALLALRTFARLQRDLAQPASPQRWSDRLARALEDLFPANPADADTRRALDTLRQTLARFAQETAAAAVTSDVPADVVRAWFDATLREDQTRAPFLSGGVNIARMVPMRLIPFRVICLIGMNDDAFPRRDPVGGLNRIAHALRSPQRRLGDRSIRDDDRLLFLQLFAAASDVFYLSWLGADPRSGESRPPSVVVAELIELAARYSSQHDAASLVIAHPLQPFAPEAFGAGDPRRHSYLSEWRMADRTRGEAVLAPFAQPLPAPEEPLEPVDHMQLLRTLLNPARAWLEGRLGLRLTPSSEAGADDEPFDRNDGLHRFGVREAVFAALLDDTGEVDADALRASLLAQARIAPGAAGRHDIAAIVGELAPMVTAWRSTRRGTARSLPFALTLGNGVLRGRLASVFDSGLHQWSVSRAHGRTRLRLELDTLLWSALGSATPVHRLIVEQGPRVLDLLPADDARDVLHDLLDLHRAALREALPWAPQSGLVYMQALATGKSEDEAFDKARVTWNERERDDPWIALALRGRDPFTPGNTQEAEQFRHLSERVFARILQSEAMA